MTAGNARFLRRKRKAASNNRHRFRGLPDLTLYFHGKTIAPCGESAIKWPHANQDDSLSRNTKIRMTEQLAARGIRTALALLIARSGVGIAAPASAHTAS